MANKLDLTGQEFGLLTAVEDVGANKHGKRMWRCLCKCGREKVVCSNELRKGTTTSCGCFKLAAHRTHGCTGHYGMSTWYNMMSRCYNPNDKRYKDYGARGIIVCDAWHNPARFCKWVAENHGRVGLQLDRKNNNGNYSPDNCHFTTCKGNSRNRRNTSRLPNGEPLIDFCERWLGRELISSDAEYQRIYKCWKEQKTLPDFVFIAMRNRAIADLDAAHKRAENGQP